MKTGENPRTIALVREMVRVGASWDATTDALIDANIPTERGVYFNDRDGGVIYRLCRDWLGGRFPTGDTPYAIHSNRMPRSTAYP